MILWFCKNEKVCSEKEKNKVKPQNPNAISTESAILNNQLNANLTGWVEYAIAMAIAWNTNKT